MEKRENIRLLSSLLFLILGILLAANPNGVIKILSYIIGTLLITFGIYAFVISYKSNKNLTSVGMISGVISVIIGIIFFFISDSIGVIIRYILGAWLLFVGIINILNLFDSLKNEKNFIYKLVFSVMILIAGLYIILRTNLVLKTVGIIIMLYAILDMVNLLALNKEDRRGVIDITDDVNITEDTAENKPDNVKIIEINKKTKSKTKKQQKKSKTTKENKTTKNKK